MPVELHTAEAPGEGVARAHPGLVSAYWFNIPVEWQAAESDAPCLEPEKWLARLSWGKADAERNLAVNNDHRLIMLTTGKAVAMLIQCLVSMMTRLHDW